MAKKTRAKKSSSTAADRDPAPAGSEEQYRRFLPEARKINPAGIRPLRADVSLALVNAQRGVNTVLAEEARLRRELGGVSIASIRQIQDVGLGLAFAAGQVTRYAPATSDLRKLISRAHELRGLLLASAEALAQAGLLPPASVAKIRQGRGAIDAAGDCVALASLFRKRSLAVRGKTPVSAADVREASDLGTQLLGVLQPKGTKRGPVAEELKAAMDTRDRFWTLFERSWEDNVWRAGAWLFARDVDRHVPALQSRVAAKRGDNAPEPIPTGVIAGGLDE